MLCIDCGRGLERNPKATTQQRCASCSKVNTQQQVRENRKNGFRSSGRGALPSHIKMSNRLCSACGVNRVPERNRRLCLECYENPPDDIALYHEFVRPIFGVEEIALVNEFYARVAANVGHLKEWWDALPEGRGQCSLS